MLFITLAKMTFSQTTGFVFFVLPKVDQLFCFYLRRPIRDSSKDKINEPASNDLFVHLQT